VFDRTSRYWDLEDATLIVTDPDGTEREVRYKRRRLIPAADGSATLVEHGVVEGDRLDNLTARYLGDPLQFWRVCDANTLLSPAEAIARVGRVIRIAMPAIGSK
jgi:hypothetical protein